MIAGPVVGASAVRGASDRIVHCVLRAKGAAATAATGGVRVLEREAGSLHGRHVIDDYAVDVLSGEGVYEDLPAALVDDDIVFCGLVFDEKTVLEAAAATRLHAHTQSTARGIHALGVHELLDLYARARSDGDHHIRLLNRAH